MAEIEFDDLDTAPRGGVGLHGPFRGTVSRVASDDGYGRITVKIPSVYGDAESPPAWPASAFAGKDHGWLLLPEVGDGVWVLFEGGDPSHPVWLGGWWAKRELPGALDVHTRGIVTSAGLKVLLDDDGTTVRLAAGKNVELTLSDDSITLQVGPTKLVVDAGGVAINDTAFRVSS